jgi:hypothetical protein
VVDVMNKYYELLIKMDKKDEAEKMLKKAKEIKKINDRPHSRF